MNYISVLFCTFAFVFTARVGCRLKPVNSACIGYIFSSFSETNPTRRNASPYLRRVLLPPMIPISAFRAILPKMAAQTDHDTFFAQVKEQYPTLDKAGYFQRDEREAMFVYRIQLPTGSHLGLLTATDVRAYIDGRLVKHEQTIAPKEEKAVKLLLERKAMIKPVLLTYPDRPALQTLLHELASTRPPDTGYDLRGITHQFWRIDDPANLDTLATHFTHIDKAYIADGHHRLAIAARLFEQDATKDRVYSAYFPASELQIWDYNRIVVGLNGCSPLTFLAMVSQVADIEPLVTAFKPTRKHELGMYLDGTWFSIRWREREVAQCIDDALASLDVSMLNHLVLQSILGIHDIRNDRRIEYSEGVKGITVMPEALDDRDGVAFSLFPVSFADFIRIANNGETMPPKSTWFEPRMKNGLLCMPL